MKRKLSSAILAGLLSAGIVAAPATAAPVAAPAPTTVNDGSSIQGYDSLPEWLKECDYDNFKDNQDPRESSYLSVRWMQCTDLADGYENGKYGKKQDITRAEALAFIYRYMDGDYTPDEDEPFRDVDEDDWFHEAVAWGKDYDIVDGYNSGKFKPRQEITRGEFATMLFRAGMNMGLELDQKDLLGLAKKFKDVDPSNPHFQAIVALAKLQIARGYEDGSFEPKATITRVEVAELTFRADQVLQKAGVR
jgi:5'-nucleotidase